MNHTKQQLEIQTFAHNITWLREHHGLSKTKMAKILGIGLKTLNRLENGEIPPRMSIAVFFAIHDYFGIPPYHQPTKLLTD